MALCDDGSNDTIFAMKEIERRKSERLHAIGGTPIIALRVTFRPITQTMGGTVHFDGKAGRTTEEIKGVGTERALSSELEAAGTVAKMFQRRRSGGVMVRRSSRARMISGEVIARG